MAKNARMAREAEEKVKIGFLYRKKLTEASDEVCNWFTDFKRRHNYSMTAIIFSITRSKINYYSDDEKEEDRKEMYQSLSKEWEQIGAAIRKDIDGIFERIDKEKVDNLRRLKKG